MTNNKPRGYFKYILALDSETSGLSFNSDDPSYDSELDNCYQALSWGLIVLESDTYKEVDKMYIEIKYDDNFIWSDKAAAVHGLTKEYLDKNGVDECEAVVQIANFIIKFWGPDNAICLLGHNVYFDKCFLRRMMRRHGIDLRFGNRLIDTNSIGAALIQSFTSDELFFKMGLPERTMHNALEDIEYTVESIRRIRTIFNKGYDTLL